jgi:HlyD family secretion protein
VVTGDIVARIAPAPQDPRALAFAQANLASAEARYNVAEAVLEETNAALSRANRELERREELFSNNLTSAEETELYRQLLVSEQARTRRAQAAIRAAEAEIESARSFLLGDGTTSSADEATIVEISAPVTGTIYNNLEENERVIPAGTPLLEISNQDNLEAIVDLLTQDAVKVEQGATVYISGWGGDNIINAVVKYIEPEAFTKISALGVEEQRVNVVIGLQNPPPTLGSEYRIEVSIVTWQANEVLTIPTSAIFQRSNGWNTFVVVDGVVEIEPVIIGQRNREYTRVIGGLSEDDQVILYPSDLISDGVSVSY